MALSDGDIILKASANHPTDDTSTAGGSMTSTVIDDSSVGEWVPNLDGEVRFGTQQDQWQCAYIHNNSGTDTLTSPTVTSDHWLDQDINEHPVDIVSNDAGDGNTKYLRLYGRATDGGALIFEDVTLSASSTVTTSGTFAQVYRAELRLVSSGALTTAVADIELKEDVTGINIGYVRAGLSVASNEWILGVPSAIGDESTFTNRRTDPTGITYESTSGGVSLPAQLLAGEKCAVYCKQICIPGMPSIQPVLQIEIYSPAITVTRKHKGSITQKIAGLLQFDHVGESVFPTQTTGLLGHSSQSTTFLITGLMGHSSDAYPTHVDTGLLGFSTQSKTPVTMALSGHYSRAGEAVVMALKGHSSPTKTIVNMPLLGHATSTTDIEVRFGHSTSQERLINTGLLGFSTRQLKAPTTVGGTSAWESARASNNYVSDNISVTFTSSTGGSTELCATHTLVISQRASSVMTFSINVTDSKQDLEWHPYGGGAYNAVMADGGEVSINVDYEGASEDFFGTFKAPSVSMSGRFSDAQLAWPGVCEADKLFAEKKTLATLNYDPLENVTDKRTALTEAADAVSVDSKWTGIKNQRLGGPYHRQNQTPGAIVSELLKLTVDEWRTDYKTVVGYDPDSGGQTWTYDLDSDDVSAHSVAPTNNDVFDKVKVLRAISTGAEQNDGSLLEVDDFGQYELTFNPPISLATTRVEYASHLGYFSNYFWYSGNTLMAARRVIGYNGLTAQAGNRIWNCDKLVVTWGERNADITATGGPGALRVYGRKTPSGTTGTGDNANEAIDQTTSRVRGSGDSEIEMPPNPLFYNSADMDTFGDRYLARIGRAQKEHSITIPLNHLIRCGDTIELDLGDRFGGNTLTLLVVGWTHSISRQYANRSTVVQCVEYV